MKFVTKALIFLIFGMGISHEVFATDISWLEMRAIGSGFGVQVREGELSSEELDQIKDTGFGFLRYGISWAVVEREKGVYDWSQYDGFILPAVAY